MSLKHLQTCTIQSALQSLEVLKRDEERCFKGLGRTDHVFDINTHDTGDNALKTGTTPFVRTFVSVSRFCRIIDGVTWEALENFAAYPSRYRSYLPT